MKQHRVSEVSGASLAFCSIATTSHLDQALLCLRSIAAQHGGAALVLLLVDGEPPRAPSGNVRYLRLQECIPEERLRQMRRRYTIPELCFAAKPYLLRKLLAEPFIQAHYFDGDCMVLADLEPLIDQLNQSDVLLTPHSLSPIPDDGRGPRPLTLLRSGTFNAGYIGVRNTEEGLRFTAWLGAMTLQYAKNAPREGMCGDQRWLDPVPVLFPGAMICRHAGANVAYWNLHERLLSRDAQGRFLVNGEALLFFHFSGFDCRLPQKLSIYQNRHDASEDCPLRQLLEAYASQLLASSGTSAHLRPTRWRRLFKFRATKPRS